MDLRIILLALALLAVMVALFVGLFSMAKGGDFNDKYGNKLMRLRVIMQFVAIILFAMIFFTDG